MTRDNELYKGFNLNWISKYRSELFGIAILSVFYFHFGGLHIEFYKNGSGIFYDMTKLFRVYFSSAGVDIFAFLSGMGLYYSFSANDDLGRYYSRRFKRILIPYAIVGIIFWIQHDIRLVHAGVERLLQDFTYVTFFTEGINNLWFIFFIGCMYLIFPAVYKLTFSGKCEPLKLAIIFVVAVMIPIMLYNYDVDFYRNIDKAITRVPAFLLGVPAGKYIKQEKRVPHILVVLLIVAGSAVRYYAVQNEIKGWESRYITSFFGLAMMLLFVYCLRAADGAVHFRGILRFFGKYSLELYLLHILIWEFMGVAMGIPLQRASRWLILTFISVALAPVLSKITDSISNIHFKENANSVD